MRAHAHTAYASARCGFTPPSAGVIARDLSEKIEASIIQHCESFVKGNGHCDLCRFDTNWEVKICKDSGLTINQSKVIKGENYIVVNYKGTRRSCGSGSCGKRPTNFSRRALQTRTRGR